MLILGMDYETTWTEPCNPTLARPTEIGAVLYDTEKRTPMKIYNSMIYSDDHPVSPPELIQLTGMTDDMRRDHGNTPESTMEVFRGLMAECDYVAAHNGNEFDKVVYEAECERLVVPVIDRPWIDTKVDVPYPDHIKTRKLTYLASEHKIPLTHTHRALFDVLLMIGVMEQYDFNDIIALSKQPNVKAVATVSFQDKDLAKKRGYYWDGENKKWTKLLKELAAKKEKAEAPFPVQLLMQDSIDM